MDLSRPSGGPYNSSLPAITDSQDKALRRNSSPVYSEGAGRLRKLEGRLALSEQSNKALLEELVRLQGELKGSIRRNEDTLREEREERLVLSEKIRAANNLYTQMMMKLARTEEKLESERNTVGTLVSHTKQVEQALMGNQQQLLSRREQMHVHVERMRDDMEDMRESVEQMQKNVRALTDDVRTMKSKHEVQTVQFGTVVQEIRQRIKKLESDTSSAMLSLTKHRDDHDAIEANTVQFKNVMDARLSDMKEILGDLRRRIETEEAERRASNQQNQLSLEQLRVLVQESDHKREQELYANSMSSKEKESLLENERTAIANKLAELSEEQGKKMLQKEIRLREDAQAKFALLEKKLREEQAARLVFEKAQRDDMDRRWQSLRAYIDEELQAIRQAEKMSQARNDQSFVRLNESISLLERQMEGGRKAIEQVLHAEITSRQSQSEKLSTRCNQLQEKLNMAIGTLQQAVGGMNSQISDIVSKAEEELKSIIDRNKDSGMRGLADMDTRLSRLTKRTGELEDLVNKLEKATQAKAHQEVGKSDQEQKDKNSGELSRWRRDTDQQFREVEQKLRPLPDEISELKSQVAALKDEIEAREAERRKTPIREPSPSVKEPDREAEPDEDTENLRSKVQKLEEEVQNTSSQVAKLDSTVETLRTVLTQKIQSEAQTRGDSITELKEQLAKIHATE